MSALKCRLPFVLVLAVAWPLSSLSAKPSVDRYFEDTNVRQLVAAAERGDAAKIERLVKGGTDVNAQGKHGFTPLLFAMMSMNKGGFKALLSHGADPHLRIDRSEFPVDSVVALAAQAEDLYWLKELVAHGADIDWKSEYVGQSPLYFAIRERRLGNVSFLTESGADIEYRDAQSNTPLLYAAKVYKYDSVLILLEKGADWRAKDRRARGIVDRLLEYTARGASGTINLEGDLWIARTKTIEWLRDHGAELPQELLDSVPPSPKSNEGPSTERANEGKGD